MTCNHGIAILLAASLAATTPAMADHIGRGGGGGLGGVPAGQTQRVDSNVFYGGDAQRVTERNQGTVGGFWGQVLALRDWLARRKEVRDSSPGEFGPAEQRQAGSIAAGIAAEATTESAIASGRGFGLGFSDRFACCRAASR